MVTISDFVYLTALVLIVTVITGIYIPYLHSKILEIQRDIGPLDTRIREINRDIGGLDARLRAIEGREPTDAQRSPVPSGARSRPSIPDLPHSPKRPENGAPRRVSDERRNKFLWLVEDYKRTLPERDLRVDRFFETVLTFDARYSPRPVDPSTAPPTLEAHTSRLIDIAIDALERQAAGKANAASVLPLVDMALEAVYREIASVPAPPQDH